MIFKVVVVFFTLQTFSCLGEQAFLSQPDENPMELLEVTSTIQTSQDNIKYVNVTQGYFGDYKSFEFAPRDYVACGVRLRVEPSQDYRSGFLWITYNDVDDTSTNAIQIISCNLYDWTTKYNFTLNLGLWGDWGDTLMCDKDQYMYGAVAQVYPGQGRDIDDTVFNGIRILCADREGRLTSYKEFNGMQGEFTRVDSEFEKLRTQGYKVIGGRVRFEASQGDGDDTALNGLELALKKFPLLRIKRDERTTTVFEGYGGDWRPKFYSPDNELACGMKRNYYDEDELEDIELLYCNIYNEDHRPKGDRVCSKGKYISGVKINYRVQADSNLIRYFTDIIFSCTDKYGGNKEWLNADTRWYDWYDWYKSTDEFSVKNKFVCGKQVEGAYLAIGLGLSFCGLN
jgi:hypothetical protein